MRKREVFSKSAHGQKEIAMYKRPLKLSKVLIALALLYLGIFQMKNYALPGHIAMILIGLSFLPPFETYIRLAGVRRAAKSGTSAAQALLGEYYLEGSGGVKKDPEKALLWLRKSAAQNNSFAVLDLSRCYREGKGVPKDTEKADALLKKSASLGNKEAKKLLQA